MPTRSRTLFFLLLLFLPAATFARDKKADKAGNTEQGLVNRLINCLARKDAYAYINLWPDIDTLTKVAMQHSDSNSKDFREAYELQENPVKMMHSDSVFKARLKADFDSLIADGEAQGIHWESIVLTRYELVKQRETRAKLYEKMAPVRFVGYLFFADIAGQRTYALQAGDILQISGAWWGGRLRELYEASTRDEWEEVRYLARKERKLAADSLARDTTAKKKHEAVATESEQDLNIKAPEVIAERKFYTGMFDNEIPVQLYVRSLKGGCPTGICSWEAIYKFGDQDDYIRLEVTRSEDGKWSMLEVPPSGSMDLELKGGVFTGAWNSADGQTGYDVKLTEVPASPKKQKRLDEIITALKAGK